MLLQNVVILDKEEFDRMNFLIESMNALLERMNKTELEPINKTDDADKLLTPDDVCEMLSISKSLFYELTATEDIKPFGYVGKVKRYRKADILAYVQSTKNKPTVLIPKQNYRRKLC